MACLNTLKQEIRTLESIFPKNHDRFQIVSASVDELSCRFVGKNGKKYEIHANITVSRGAGAALGGLGGPGAVFRGWNVGRCDKEAVGRAILTFNICERRTAESQTGRAQRLREFHFVGGCRRVLVGRIQG